MFTSGDHFEKLANEDEVTRNDIDKETTNKPKKPLIEEVIGAEEQELQKRVENALANDAVRIALQDHKVKSIIHALSSDPEKAQR